MNTIEKYSKSLSENTSMSQSKTSEKLQSTIIVEGDVSKDVQINDDENGSRMLCITDEEEQQEEKVEEDENNFSSFQTASISSSIFHISFLEIL